MSRREAVRRTDLLACGAMLVAGLLAQLAMWRASTTVPVRGTKLYEIATPLLLFVSGLAARRAWRGYADESSPAQRILVMAAKVAAAAAMLGGGILTGSLAAFRHAGQQHPSTATAIGAVLLVVQIVQTASITSRRDIALGAPVVCAMVTQAGMVTHDASPGVPFATALVAMVVAIALVYRGELLEESRGRQATSSWTALAAGAGSPLLRVGVVAAIVFVLLPNSFSLRARADTHHGGSVAGARPAAGDVPGKHSEALTDPSSGRLDLRVRGALASAPVFVVSATSPGYWQGAVYDDYDGVSWSMSGPPGPMWDASTSSSGLVTQHAPADSSKPKGAVTTSRTDQVQTVSTAPLGVVFAPGRAIAYDGPGTVTTDADGNPRLRDVAATGPPSSRDYDVTSTRPAPPDTLTAPLTGAGDPVDPRWTQLPVALPERVKALGARVAGDAATRADAVAAVDDYLRANDTYNLSAPLPASGEDAVDDFLFNSHQGFCEQFATAAVVLLRSVGVPARLVTGFSKGDLRTEPGKRIMRGSDAHAWMQVWYPGVGWVDDDPTASSVLGVAPGGGTTPASVSPAGAVASSGSASPSTSGSAATSGSASSSVSSSASESAAGSPSPRAGSSDAGAFGLGSRLLIVAVVALGALLGALLLGLGRRLSRRRGRRGGSPSWLGRGVRAGGFDAGAAGPVLRAYLRLDETLAAAGRARAAGETPREVAASLGPSEAGLRRAIDLLERECFGAEPLSDADTAYAVGVFDDVAERTAGVIRSASELAERR